MMIKYIFRVAVSIMFYGFTASLFAQEVCNSMSDDVRFDCTNPIPVCALPYTFNYDATQHESNLIYEIDDHFNGSSIDGWIPLSTTSGLSNVNERLTITKTGGSGVLGVYKNFNAIAGKTYRFKATVEKGQCNPNAGISIVITDNNGGSPIHTETSYNQIFTADFTFVAAVGGSYTIEIKRVGAPLPNGKTQINNSNCTFYLDDITLTYLGCNPKSMWHVFYIGGSNITLGITDNNSELFNAKLYGSFIQGQTSVEETCGGIANGSIVPVAVATALTNNSLQLSASNLTAGWYLLEIIDNDCKGCIEITAIEGQITCSPSQPCSGNRSCETKIKACNNQHAVLSACQCGDNSIPIKELWFEIDIDNINQGIDILSNYTGSITPYPFYYAIFGPLANNYNCELLNENDLLISGTGPTQTTLLPFSTSGSGKYILVIYASLPCFSANNYSAEFDIIFSPQLDCEVFVCPPNSTCESIINLCEDAHVEAPCDCGTGSGSKQLWYKFDVNDPMQEFDITGSVLPFGGGTINLNFTYTIVKLVPGVFNCNPNQETAFVATGNQSTSNFSFNQTNAGIGTYILVIVVGCDGNSNYELDLAFTPQLNCFPPPPCEDCIGSFKPLPEGKYVLSAWVKESGVPSSTTTYLNSSIKIHLYNADYSEIPTNLEYYGQGAIIDEWQRLEGEFIIPDFAAYIGIELIAQNGDAYFDDIRVSPFDASMKSYVYDPVNLRLVAELDERNYATFYEYDEEGKLIRVKKETERGIMTIQETRYNTSKK